MDTFIGERTRGPNRASKYAFEDDSCFIIINNSITMTIFVIVLIMFNSSANTIRLIPFFQSIFSFLSCKMGAE